MIKKIIISFILMFCFIPYVNASKIDGDAIVNGKVYDNLEDAIKNASSTDTIKLVNDVDIDNTLVISKTVNIDLNGNDITSDGVVFQVEGGVLNLEGKGSIIEQKPSYGAIMVKGSSDNSKEYYSVVNIGSDVSLQGWSGVFINHNNSKAYGVVVNLEGNINAVDDTEGGTGVGVYVNGNIKDEVNRPIVNIDGASITSTGNGLYIAGNSTFNIKNSYINGIESAIGMKSGSLNIEASTIECSGSDDTPTEGYNNGIKASGTAIQIESNNGYAGGMDINIKSGDYKSKNSYVIYEYIGRGTTSLVDNITISGGNFTSDKKDVFLVSDSFKDKHSKFITGGKFSSNPNMFLASGYTTSVDSDIYTVVKSTMGSILKIDSSNNNYGIILIATILIVGIGVVVYLNRSKIFN